MGASYPCSPSSGDGFTREDDHVVAVFCGDHNSLDGDRGLGADCGGSAFDSAGHFVWRGFPMSLRQSFCRSRQWFIRSASLLD